MGQGSSRQSVPPLPLNWRGFHGVRPRIADPIPGRNDSRTQDPCMNRIALAAFLSAVGVSSAADEPTSVVATTYYRTFSHAHPILRRIKPGETVATKTVDSAGLDEKDVKRSE